MYLKFSAHAYFRTRNSNLKSVSNKNQLEISRNLIRDNRIVHTQAHSNEHTLSRIICVQLIYVDLDTIFGRDIPSNS